MNLEIPAIPFRRAQLFQESPGTNRPYLCGVWIQPGRIFATNTLVYLPKMLPGILRMTDNITLLHDEGDETGLVILGDKPPIPADFPQGHDAPDINFIIPDPYTPMATEKIGIALSVISALVKAWP
jgi:hypothetical protein